jgi:hypothetical protein
MAGLKTMHDVRTLRSVVTRSAPTSDGALFLLLHRLASEKLRLEREVDLWLRKKERLEKRLMEIEQQVEHLKQVRPGGDTGSPLHSPTKIDPAKVAQRVTLEY